MNVDLSKNEIEMLDEALKEWQASPMRDGTMGSVMGSIFRSMAGGERDKEQERREMEQEKANYQNECAKRERKALLLRAKLIQALTRDSEHTFETAATPPQVATK